MRFITLPNIASIMTLVFSGLMLYLMFFPVKVFDVYNNPMATTQTIYQPGETVAYDVESCRFQEGSTSILRKLVYDNQPIQRSFTALTAPNKKSLSCPEYVNEISTQLPEDSPCGRAHLEIQYIDRATLLQVKILAVETQSFQICSDDPQGEM